MVRKSFQTHNDVGDILCVELIVNKGKNDFFPVGEHNAGECVNRLQRHAARLHFRWEYSPVHLRDMADVRDPCGYRRPHWSLSEHHQGLILQRPQNVSNKGFNNGHHDWFNLTSQRLHSFKSTTELDHANFRKTANSETCAATDGKLRNTLSLILWKRAKGSGESVSMLKGGRISRR